MVAQIITPLFTNSSAQSLNLKLNSGQASTPTPLAGRTIFSTTSNTHNPSHHQHDPPHHEYPHHEVLFSQVTRAGGEGIMLRRPTSFYEHGRSDHLLKLKVFVPSSEFYPFENSAPPQNPPKIVHFRAPPTPLYGFL